MTAREKLVASLDHRSGPVPVDFGSNPVTGMHCTVVEALRKHYGLEERRVTVIDPYQMLGQFDADLQEVIGIDVTGVFPRNTMFGFPNENWKEWRTPWRQVVLVPEGFVIRDDGGDTLIFPEGDDSAPPSGRMPEGGYFFDALIRQPRIDEDALDPSDNTEEFVAVSDADLDFYEQACRSAESTGRGTVINIGGMAIGDISMVPGVGLKHPRGIRDITEWYISTVMRQDYLHGVFRIQTEVAIENLKRVFARVGNIPDVIFVCGTDFGTQNSQFCSVDTYRELYHPYYAQINGWIHDNTTWKTFKHSCGAVEPFMPEFIASGFDIVNPVQLSAAGMDAKQLKANYGDRLTFWGGVTDTQKTLPFGTPEEVRSEVQQRLEILSTNGGYVFNAIHNVQAATPVANVVAMIEAVKAFNEGR